MDTAPAPAPQGDSDVIVPQIYYLVHGWFAFVAFAFLFPLAIMISRFGQGLSKRLGYGHSWFPAHYILNILGVFFATVSLAVAYAKFGLPLDIAHMRLGVALGLLIWLQPFIALIRPKRGARGRVPWYMVHWLFGVGAVVLGVINIQLGMNAFKELADKDNYPGDTMHTLFAVYIACVGFIYLFLGQIPYLSRQRSADDWENLVIPEEKHKPNQPLV